MKRSELRWQHAWCMVSVNPATVHIVLTKGCDYFSSNGSRSSHLRPFSPSIVCRKIMVGNSLTEGSRLFTMTS